MQKTKVVIYVAGGVVQEVLSNDPEIEIVLMDQDNWDEDPDSVGLFDEAYAVAVKDTDCVPF